MSCSMRPSKVLRLPHKTTFDTSWNMLKCHKAPSLPREMKLRDTGTPFAKLTISTAIWSSHGRLRTVANVCGRLRTVVQRLANTAQPPHPQSETGTLATHSGKIFWSTVTIQKIFKSKDLKKELQTHPLPNIQVICCMSLFHRDLSKSELHNILRIAAQQCRTSILREDLTKAFHCDLHRINCKTL